MPTEEMSVAYRSAMARGRAADGGAAVVILTISLYYQGLVDGGGVLHCDDIGGVQFTKHGEFGGHENNYEILKYLRHESK